MNNEVEQWLEESKTLKVGRTYFDGIAFLHDMRNGDLMDQFFLSEGAFQEILGEVAASRKVAEEVNNAAVPISLKADRGLELGGILELAETIANGR
jgi:hypothetical protein